MPLSKFKKWLNGPEKECSQIEYLRYLFKASHYPYIHIKTLFGNDFKKKNTHISISQNINRYEYLDSFSKKRQALFI